MEPINLEKFLCPDIPVRIGKKLYILSQPTMEKYLEMCSLTEDQIKQMSTKEHEKMIRSWIGSMLKEKGFLGLKAYAFKRLLRRWYGENLRAFRSDLMEKLGWSHQATPSPIESPGNQESSSA